MGLVGLSNINAISKQLEIVKNRTKLSERAESVIQESKKTYEPFECDKQYDLVYILKEADYNPDLVMSLRSIEKFCTYRKVWIVGYKPSWLKNVYYLPTDQSGGTKWANSCLNWKTACECKDISNDFILMNDDFIALRPIIDWKNSLNVCLGSIQDEAQKYSKKAKISRWQKGFINAENLLIRCHAKTCYNYEAHIPIMINKTDYLKFLQMNPIKEFMQTPNVLHKRSLYKNLFPDPTLSFPHKIKDVKISLGYDLTDNYFKENWISVFDDVIENHLKFPKINKFLSTMFSEKSNFEK